MNVAVGNYGALISPYSKIGNEYHFHFMAKGGGSANKTFLYQETKALLNPDKLRAFLEKNVKTIGTAACPPYHLGIPFFVFCLHAFLLTVHSNSVRCWRIKRGVVLEDGQASFCKIFGRSTNYR